MREMFLYSYAGVLAMKFTLCRVLHSQITGNNLARSQRSPEHTARLNESVARFDVLTPILLHKKGETYTLIAGFGRREASIAAGKADIPAQVFEGNIEPLELLILACQENNVREAMSFLDQIDALEKIIKGKKITDTEAGKLIGLKQSVTSKILSAKSRLEEDVLLKLSENGYGYSFAYPLSRVSPSEQREACEKLIGEKWTRAELESFLKPDAKRTVKFGDSISLSLSFPKDATYESITEAISGFLRDIKKRQSQDIPTSLLSQVMQ